MLGRRYSKTELSMSLRNDRAHASREFSDWLQLIVAHSSCSWRRAYLVGSHGLMEGSGTRKLRVTTYDAHKSDIISLIRILILSLLPRTFPEHAFNFKQSIRLQATNTYSTDLSPTDVAATPLSPISRYRHQYIWPVAT